MSSSLSHPEHRRAYLPHQSKMVVHFGLHAVDLREKRVFEAPQNLVDGSVHEYLDAQAVHVHGHYSSQEKGVGVQLVHHRLGMRDNASQVKKKNR